MPQDAFTLRLNAAELDGALKGGKVNKIVQPTKDEVSLVIYTGRHTVRLVLNTNASDCGAYFDRPEAESPLVAPNFCMLLRKHLQGAEILSVSLVGFERILLFRFLSSSDFSRSEQELYLEVMGKYSNLVLVEKGIILGALKTTTLDENVRRTIFSGVAYVLPAPQDKICPLDREKLKEAFRTDSIENLAQFLFSHVSGLAPSTAEQIAKSYRGGDLAEHVYSYIFSDTVSPCVVERDGIPVDFYARMQEDAIPFPTLSEAQTYCYGKKRAAKKFENLKRKLTSAVNGAVKKHEKRLAQTLEKKHECENCELLRIKGELLTANLFMLSKGLKGCELDNWYEEQGGKLKITLDPLLSPSQNAQNYFKRYRKQKRTLEMLVPQEEETRAELNYLASMLGFLSSAESETDLLSMQEELVAAGLIKDSVPQRRGGKAKAEIPFRTFDCGGFRILAGRNNLQNDKLVRTSSPNDIWLHAQRYHSSHVVIKTEGRRVPDEVIAYAANLCAKFSDGGGDRIPVDYCLVKFVKKPPKSKAGFVIYSEFTTVAGYPDKV